MSVDGISEVRFDINRLNKGIKEGQSDPFSIGVQKHSRWISLSSLVGYKSMSMKSIFNRGSKKFSQNFYRILIKF